MPVRGLAFQVLASWDALADVLHCTVPAWDVPLIEHLQMFVKGLPFQVLASWDALADVLHWTVPVWDVPLHYADLGDIQQNMFLLNH